MTIGNATIWRLAQRASERRSPRDGHRSSAARHSQPSGQELPAADKWPQCSPLRLRPTPVREWEWTRCTRSGHHLVISEPLGFIGRQRRAAAARPESPQSVTVRQNIAAVHCCAAQENHFRLQRRGLCPPLLRIADKVSRPSGQHLARARVPHSEGKR